VYAAGYAVFGIYQPSSSHSKPPLTIKSLHPDEGLGVGVAEIRMVGVGVTVGKAVTVGEGVGVLVAVSDGVRVGVGV
jgi:hypothetical protein